MIWGAIFLLMEYTLSNMKVYSPSFLVTKYESIPFQHKISSFGKVPYGHTIMGVVRMPYPATGCGKDTRVNYDSTTKDPLILLVLRGDCSFLEKVENGQRLKAQLVIIVDNLDEEMTHVLPWSEGAPSLDILLLDSRL